MTWELSKVDMEETMVEMESQRHWLRFEGERQCFERFNEEGLGETQQDYKNKRARWQTAA